MTGTAINGTTGPAPPEKTLYIGTFIHSISLTELEVCENGVIGVDERGKIAFVEKDGKGKREEGWEAAKVVRIRGEGVGFFFPGFIGESSTLWSLVDDTRRKGVLMSIGL